MEKTFICLLITLLFLSCSSHETAVMQGDTDTFRNATVVISDIHMGDSRACGHTNQKAYGWLSENKKELVNFLNSIKSTNWIKELVIAGDLIDQWVAPVNVRVWGDNTDDNESIFLDSVRHANTDIVNAFVQIKNAGIEIHYTPGNHDMSINQDKLDRLFGKNTIICENKNDAKGLGFYNTQNNLVRIEHGHRLDFFNAPDCISNIDTNENSIIPLGFIVSKIASSSDMNKSRGFLNCDTGPKWFDALYRDYDLYLAAWKLILYNKPNSIDTNDWDKKIIQTGDLINHEQTFSYSDIIPTFWGNFNDRRTIYKNTYKTSEWNARQEINNVPVKLSIREALLTGVFPSYFDDTAIAEYLQVQGCSQKVLVMGHTHSPALKKVKTPDGDKIYVNSGSWVDKKWLDKKTPTKTFVVIKNNDIDKTCCVELFEFNNSIKTSALLGSANIDDIE